MNRLRLLFVRGLVLLLLSEWLAMSFSTAEPPVATNAPPAVPDPGAEARVQVPDLYRSWKTESDPVRRKGKADQLLDAIIKCYENQPLELADEVARDGLPRKEAAAPKDSIKVTLHPLMTLPDARTIEYPASPVFRRISATRFEAWTSKEGWLFDQDGKALAHVTVPRRDGVGREWFGAFLPNGRWITTDLWAEDKQVNAFSAQGRWLWVIPGEKILAASPLPSDDFEPHPKPLIDWARADKTGKRWLVSVGANLSQVSVLIDQKGGITKLPKGVTEWSEVYPRAMGVRGGYVAFGTSSDDGAASLGFTTVAHGPFCNWPTFDTSLGWGVRMHDTTLSFGFWPRSHAVYIEQRGPDGQSPDLIWVFDAKGRYQGEVHGFHLGDAANGRDLLLTDANSRVLRVSLNQSGLSVPQARQFLWPDGSIAVPLTMYDDLRLGFFQRGPGIVGLTDDARRARSRADIVLAKFRN
jgi:hypothetical protein